MNIQHVLIIFFLTSITGLQVEAIPTLPQVLAENKPCKCYCSDGCGPRDAWKESDAPFIDPETGICFCQERDRQNYHIKFKRADGRERLCSSEPRPAPSALTCCSYTQPSKAKIIKAKSIKQKSALRV